MPTKEKYANFDLIKLHFMFASSTNSDKEERFYHANIHRIYMGLAGFGQKILLSTF